MPESNASVMSEAKGKECSLYRDLLGEERFYDLFHDLLEYPFLNVNLLSKLMKNDIQPN